MACSCDPDWICVGTECVAQLFDAIQLVVITIHCCESLLDQPANNVASTLVCTKSYSRARLVYSVCFARCVVWAFQVMENLPRNLQSSTLLVVLFLVLLLQHAILLWFRHFVLLSKMLQEIFLW